MLRGVIIFLFGILAIVSPGTVLLTLILYLGVIAVISGAILIIDSFEADKNEKVIKIIEGIIYILFGFLFIFKPDYIVKFTMIFLALWALLAGLFQIYSAIKLRKVINNEWLMILNGVISVIFAILIFTNIIVSVQAIVMVLGIYALVSGIFMILLSFKVKSLKS